MVQDGVSGLPPAWSDRNSARPASGAGGAPAWGRLHNGTVHALPWQDVELRGVLENIGERRAAALEQATDTGLAPWHIIGATDMKYRDLAMGSILVKTLEEALADDEEAGAKPAANIWRDYP